MVAGYENLLGALAVAVLHQYLRDTRWLVQKRDINSLDRIRKYLSFLACAKVDPRASVVDSSTIPCAAQFAGGDHRAGVTRICSAYILSLTNREGTCRHLTGAWRKKGAEIPTEEQKLTGRLPSKSLISITFTALARWPNLSFPFSGPFSGQTYGARLSVLVFVQDGDMVQGPHR